MSISESNSPFAPKIESSVLSDGTFQFKYSDSRVYYQILKYLGIAFEKQICPKDMWTGQLTGEEGLNFVMLCKIAHLTHIGVDITAKCHQCGRTFEKEKGYGAAYNFCSNECLNLFRKIYSIGG